MKRAAELRIDVSSQAPASATAVVGLDPAFAGFAGHFPGDPILPAMCHVDLALRATARALGAQLDLVAVGRARFMRKVRPGEELSMRLSFSAPRDATITVTSAHTVGGAAVADLQFAVRLR